MEKVKLIEKYSEILETNNLLCISVFQVKFTDERIDEDYNANLVKTTKKARIISNLLTLGIIFLRIFTSRKERITPIYFYIDLSFGIIALGLFFTYHFLITNFNIVKLMSFLFSIWVSLINIYSTITSTFYYLDPNLVIQIRDAYVLSVIAINELLFSLEYNFPFALIMFILNVGTIIIVSIFNTRIDNEGFEDVILFGLFFLLCIYFKRINTIIHRENYLHSHNCEKFFSYFFDLIDNMNGLYFTLKNKVLSIYNNTFKGHVSDYNKDIKEKNIFKDKRNLTPKINHNSNSDGLLKPKLKELNMKNDIYINIEKQKKNHHSYKEKNEFIQKEEYLSFNKYAFDSSQIKNEKNDINHSKIKISNNESKEKIIFNQKSEGKDTFISEEEKINTVSFEKMSEIFLKSMKLISINPELDFLIEDNLLAVINNISKKLHSEINNGRFNYLGDFYIEDKKGYFQVFFKKHLQYVDLVDFLIFDLSEIKKAEAKEFNLKSKFFAKIAHEFKTPLNSIINLVEKLININENEIDLCDTDIRKLLIEIDNLSNYLIFLINDIIEYSEIYSDKNHNFQHLPPQKDHSDKIISKSLSLKGVDLQKVTKFCLGVLNTLLTSKGKEKYIETKFDFDQNILHYNILSDEVMLKEILLNLLSNSVKFTKSGSITIKSLVEFASNKFNLYEKAYVRISIIDTGLGIRECDLKRLREFKETSYNEYCNYNTDGSGLGLIITKSLLNKLNHEIEIESEYGKGSDFSIILQAEKKGLSFNIMIDQNNFNENEISKRILRDTELKQFHFDKLNNKKSDSKVNGNRTLTNGDSFNFNDYFKNNLSNENIIHNHPSQEKRKCENDKKMAINSEAKSYEELKNSIVTRSISQEIFKNILKMNLEIESNFDDKSIYPNEIHFKRRKYSYNNQYNGSEFKIFDFDKTLEYSKNMFISYSQLNLTNTPNNNLFDKKLLESDIENNDFELNKSNFKNKTNLNILDTIHEESFQVSGLHQYEDLNVKIKEILIIDDHVYIRETLKNIIKKILLKKKFD